MKIGICGLNQFIGGMEISLIELCRYINKHTKHSSWISIQNETFPKDFSQSRTASLVNDYGLTLYTMQEAYKEAKDTNAIIIYRDGMETAEFLNIPFRIAITGGDVHIEQFDPNSFTHVWTKSEEMRTIVKKKTKKNYGFLVCQTPINIDYWSDTVKIPLTDKLKDQFVIGIVGRNDPLKNLDDLFNFAEQMPKEDHLLVLSSGSNLDRKRIKKENTTLIQQSMAKNYYPLINILIKYSSHEGVPRSLMEAMCNKVPIITSDIGGIPQLGCKIITPYGNKDEFMKNLKQLRENPTMRKDVGEFNYQRIQTYNEENCLKILDFFNELERKL